MIFATDSGEVVIVEGVEKPYNFFKSKEVSEQELFTLWKQEMFNYRGRKDLIDPLMSRYNIPKYNSTQHSGLTTIKLGAMCNVKCEAEKIFPFHGVYIVPKLYGYFPFLDCDTKEQQAECLFHLELDKIPHVIIESSKHSKWIICDREGNFKDTLSFIKSYPADPRYSWIAEYKEEFVIRGAPKMNKPPVLVERNDMGKGFSKNFQFWLDDFEKYWKTGLIPSYVEIMSTLNAI